MNSNSTLISIGQFDLKLNHLLVVGILSLSFSMSFLVRSQPAEWGWELNEFDPFFNYRATEYLVNNGYVAYSEWNDELSWYPHGRNVSENSQVSLHLIAAITYWIFGAGGDLYGFTILFPVIFGSLTTIAIFALVRTIGGTTAGLLSALFFSVSIPILSRGSIGWFKSEPLGLFLALLTMYLLLSGIKSKNKKILASKLIGSGILLGLGFASWGGIQFLVMPIGIFIISLPFLNNNRSLFWAIPLFTLSVISVAISFERPGIIFITSLGGMGLIVPTAFFVTLSAIKNFSNVHPNRNMILFLISVFIIILSLYVVNAEFLPSASFRYLNAINPFLTTTNALVDSVSEHATTTLEHSFMFHSVLMIFAAIGIWLLMKNSSIRNDMKYFALLFGIMGVYTASTFLRLEVFASISVIILASLGISILAKSFFSTKIKSNNLKNLTMQSSFGIGLIILLIIPLTSLAPLNVFQAGDNPQTIINGGTQFAVASNDWNDSLDWIKNNTPENSVIASWWDYGYWIQTKSDRATLADNSTLYTSVIEAIAKIFLATPDDGWKMLQEKQADYFVIFIAGQRLNLDGNENQPLYILGGGADESKKQWFIKIAGEDISKYIHSDGLSGTDHFWNDTLLGNMIPFNLLGYVHFESGQQSLSYQPGFTAIYEKNVKFSMDGHGPLRLVYSSPSYNDASNGESVLGVFVYEINKDYVSLN